MKIIFVAAAIAMAAGASTANAQNKPEEEPKKEKKICKSEPVTGSLTRVRRTCLTQSEWDELSDRTIKQVGEFVKRQNDRLDVNRPSPGPN